VLDVVNSLETAGHRFELITLRKEGENWLAQFAIDGQKYPAFYEPHANVCNLKDREFMQHLQAQALTNMEYCREAA